MKFGEAIEMMKSGERVSRSGWNGKGMWLALQVPNEKSKMTLPYIYMSTVTGDLVPWLASQTDVLADDWVLTRTEVDADLLSTPSIDFDVGKALKEAEAAIYKKNKTDVRRRIDLKHHITTRGELVKSGNGVPIPDDEPLILFRARDHLAIMLLLNYHVLCRQDGCNDFQLGQVEALIKSFSDWAAKNPEKMKQPGVTKGL